MKGIGKNRNRLNGMNDGIGLQEVLTVFDWDSLFVCLSVCFCLLNSFLTSNSLQILSNYSFILSIILSFMSLRFPFESCALLLLLLLLPSLPPHFPSSSNWLFSPQLLFLLKFVASFLLDISCFFFYFDQKKKGQLEWWGSLYNNLPSTMQNQSF